MSHARGWAIVSLALLAAGVVALIYDIASDLPRAAFVALAIVLGLALAWEGMIRTGPWRAVLLTVAAVLLAGALISIALEGAPLADLVVFGLLAGAVVSGRAAFSARTPLPSTPPPSDPVLFVNPWSGGGKAKRFDLVAEARSRGYRTVELGSGDDLRRLVEDAVESGADGLAMAGGDGSQAIVASIAAARNLPYACIPSGTRNHFALDLGVDRDDVVGALDAFGETGGEHVVDLAEVNDRVFVNNVSLGIYSVAVQRDSYRDAKLRTLLDTVPELFGPEGKALDLRWRGHGGNEHSDAATILVSNNRYRLGRAIGNATRPRIDDGMLGITVLAAPRRRGIPLGFQRPWREWSATTFEVEADGLVPSGIDGEAVTLDAPLRFRILPGVLRARIAAAHPGASPSARMPDTSLGTIGAIAAIALGREPATPTTPR